MLQGYLTWFRESMLMKFAGLTGEQLAQRSVPPSVMSLLGLIRHMAKVERTWFRIRFAGQPVAPLHPAKDVDFDEIAPEEAEREYALLLEEMRLADEAAAGASLDDRFVHNGDEYSLRLIYQHVIGEYARHTGHADFLREQIDGLTGA